MPPNNTWALKEITRESRKYYKLNKNENTAYQNLQDEAKAVLIEKKKKGLNAYIKQEEKSQINNLSFHHKKLEK